MANSSSTAGSGSNTNNHGSILPLLPCPFCGKMLFTSVCRRGPNAGKRFYKCTRLEHTPQACVFYKFEDDYLEWLLSIGWRGPVHTEALPPTSGNLPDLRKEICALNNGISEVRAQVSRNQNILRTVLGLSHQMLALVGINFAFTFFMLWLVWSK